MEEAKMKLVDNVEVGNASTQFYCSRTIREAGRTYVRAASTDHTKKQKRKREVEITQFYWSNFFTEVAAGHVVASEG